LIENEAIRCYSVSGYQPEPPSTRRAAARSCRVSQPGSGSSQRVSGEDLLEVTGSQYEATGFLQPRSSMFLSM
jgi:hypothetical protein